MNTAHKNKAAVLKALGHPIRFCIVEGLIQSDETRQHVGAMVSCTGVAQPTVSQHLNILKNAGVVKVRRDGTHMLYQVCSPEARKIVRALQR